MTDVSPLRSLLVVGTGLIGTSIGLAARQAGLDVWLADDRREHVDAAVSLGAGAPWRGRGDRAGVDHVVVSVPPAATAAVVRRVLGEIPDATVSDTASVKSSVLAAVAAATPRDATARFVGGHPMAGGERSGPLAARPDLFRGRPWVLTPGDGTLPDAIARARGLAELCGAGVVLRSADDHDRAVAAVSHLPQLLASALAAELGRVPEDVLAVAGQGVRDMTRIAASDPRLWAGIVAANREPVHEVLAAVHADLGRLVRVLADAADPRGEGVVDAVAGLVARGNAGHERLPGKHGGALEHFATVSIVVPDRPGALARAFTVLGDAGVNVEELAVDHAPGQPMGSLQIAVAPERADDAVRALDAGGFYARREQ